MEKKLEEKADTISTSHRLLEFLLKLSDTLRSLDNPVKIEEAATKLALDFMEADRCHYGSIEGDNVIILQDASRGDLPSIAGVHTISSLPLYKATLKEGLPFVVDNVRTTNKIDEYLKQLCLHSRYESFIIVPVIKNGKPLGLLSLVQGKPRKWIDAEVQFTIKTAERIGAAVERAQAEEVLRKSDFRTMADSSPALIWTIDANGLSSYYNKTFLDFIGVENNEDIADWGKIVHPDDIQSTFETINSAMAVRRSYSLECRLLRADGQWRWVLAQGNPRMGANDEFLGFVGSSIDITERKQAEEKIKESEFRFHELIYSSPSMMAILKGEDMIIEIANDPMITSWGKGKEVIGKPLFLVLPEVVEQGFDKLLLNVYKTGEPFHAYETPVTLLQNGIKKTIYYNFVYQVQRNLNGEIEGVAILANEVTTQALLNNKIKASEQELRKIKEQLELSIRAGKIGVWHWDIKQDTLYWSEEQKIIHGLEPSSELLNLAQYRAMVIPEDWERLNKDLQSVPLPEEQEYDLRIIRKNDGEIRWIKSRTRNILDQQGALQFISGVNIDVTEQVIALTKLQASEEKFKRLVLQAPVAICVLRGAVYVIETMNEGMCIFWDRTLAQALNKPVFDVLPEAKDQGIKELLDHVYLTGERCVIQELSVNIKRNGKLENVFVKFVYEPLREADGTISGVMALAHEITEQVIARKKVEESEKRFEAAMLAVEGIIWTNNAQGEMIGEQPGWAELTGQHFEEYQGYGWAKAIHPDDAQPTVDAWNNAVATKSTFEFEHRVKTVQKEWRLFSVKAVPAFDKNGVIQQWVGVHTDITEQKLEQEKLAYRTALLEAHNEASIDGILLVDAKGKIISFNQRFIEIWNMPQHIVNAKDDEAALSFAMTQLVHPQLFIDKVKYHYTHPNEISLDELEFKDGKIVERNGYPVIGDDGSYYAWSWTFRDITEQKNYEKIIIQSEQRFRTLAETLPQLIWMTNEKGAYEYASSHWINYSGLDPFEGDTWEKLVHPLDLESLSQGWESSLQTGNTFYSEARLKNKNGTYSWHLVQGEPIKNEKGDIIKWIGAFTDIENLKEEQKQKNDFLSMASHELRTPVTTIKGYGQIIERLLEEKNDLQTLGFVKKMGKQVNRLNRLISDLLDITKMQKGGLIRNESAFNFNDFVKEVVDDMQKTTVTHQIIDNLNADIEIQGDKDKLSQVLDNLISNATKYSPAADKIIVSTQIVKDGVQLSVQDFGIGISIEGQKRVFEQFYRVAGENQSTFQGMGIGLYICAEIIKKEGGNIWVESTGGKGSVFYVWLPVDLNDGSEG